MSNDEQGQTPDDISTRYGEARMALARAKKEASHIAKSLEALYWALRENPELVKVDRDLIYILNSDRSPSSKRADPAHLDVERIHTITSTAREALVTIKSLEPKMKDLGIID